MIGSAIRLTRVPPAQGTFDNPAVTQSDSVCVPPRSFYDLDLRLDSARLVVGMTGAIRIGPSTSSGDANARHGYRIHWCAKVSVDSLESRTPARLSGLLNDLA